MITAIKDFASKLNIKAHLERIAQLEDLVSIQANMIRYNNKLADDQAAVVRHASERIAGLEKHNAKLRSEIEDLRIAFGNEQAHAADLYRKLEDMRLDATALAYELQRNAADILSLVEGSKA